MERNEILKLVAPCGLLCYTCDAMKNGVINKTAKKLLYVLDSYDSFLANSPDSRPIAGKYGVFIEVLTYFAAAQCHGCREDRCLNTSCFVPECTKKQQIDFCYECKEFPCAKTGFPDDLQEKWIRKNKRIKAVGLEQFFAEEKNLPHYAS